MVAANRDYKREINGYYVKLTKFLEVTGADPTSYHRSTKRAEKARSKLSNLSLRQFYELNVDVDDELARRMSEDDAKSLNFEMDDDELRIKRNTARKKLSSLSDSRFNELICDLISEVIARGFDKFEDGESDSVINKSNENTVTSSFNMSDLGSVTTRDETDLNNAPEVASQPTSASKSSTDDHFDFTEDTPAAPSSPSHTVHTEIPENSVPISDATDIPKEEQEADLNATPATAPTSAFQSSKIIPLKASIDWSDEDENDEEETPTKIESDIVQEMKVPIVQPVDTKNSDKTLSYDALVEENNRLKAALNNQAAPTSTSNHFYQANSSVDMKLLEKYVDNDLGCIPMGHLVKYHQTIEYFYQVLNGGAASHSDSGDAEDSLGTTLFKVIFQISKTVQHMIDLVDIPIFKREIILLKSAVSHAITAVRYYSMYGDILPKYTVHAALGDISFAICNLIKSAKLKDVSTSVGHSILTSIPETPLANIDIHKSLIHSTAAHSDIPIKQLKLTRNLQNHIAGDLRTPTKQIPKRNASRRKSGRLSFMNDTELHIPKRSASRPASKPSSQSSLAEMEQVTNVKEVVEETTKNVVSRNSSKGSRSNRSSVNRKSSKGGKPPKNKKRSSHATKGANSKTGDTPEHPFVAASPEPSKKSAKSAKKFTDKIKSFGNNNSLGFRVMHGDKAAKVK
ncbi:Sph1 protein [Maudiozyma humilis]|uniref:Sph1 protein n=1 Tax=Maudiozyma humilis TaxID=51915 RepID=A0AAV5S426_MAUHU|nr:Sph1 protein [Kazachstania humilis]